MQRCSELLPCSVSLLQLQLQRIHSLLMDCSVPNHFHPDRSCKRHVGPICIDKNLSQHQASLSRALILKLALTERQSSKRARGRFD
jgi:hypothetical protein